MAYNDIEISEFDNHSIELYEFKRGGFSWRYTSNDEDVIHSGLLYTAATIKRNRIEVTQELSKNTLKISMSRRVEFAAQFIREPPTDIIKLTIIKIHDGDTEDAISWKGHLLNVSFSKNEAQFSFQPIYASLKRPGLRRVYQLSCPHVLYGKECSIVKSTMVISATISAINTNELTSPEFIISINATYDAEWLVGGFIEYSVNNLLTRRFITNHDNVNGTITLNLPISNLTIGKTINVYPGCDHIPETCSGKFSNITSYGGFPFIPEKNPMDGSPVF